MERLKKFWWVFGVLGTAATFLNPYVGLFALLPALILFINGITIGTGRTRCRQKNQPGYNGIVQLQSYSFWAFLVWDIIFVPMFIAMVIFFTTTPDRKILTPVPTQGFNFANWVPFLLIASLVFQVSSIILAALRQYDLYWNKTYTMKPKRQKMASLKQPKEDSLLYKMFRIIGKGWICLATLSLAAGLFSIRFPALTLLRLFLLFPYLILLINIRLRQSVSHRSAAHSETFPTDSGRIAQDQLVMFRGKGMFLFLFFMMAFIEGIILMCEIIIPATSSIMLYVSIILDVLLILSLGDKLWELAEKK